jgi:hypothetical protein
MVTGVDHHLPNVYSLAALRELVNDSGVLRGSIDEQSSLHIDRKADGGDEGTNP